MCDRLFQLNTARDGNLQKRVRETIVNAILDGHIPRGGAIPSCRKLARQLSVSRNTVVLTYERLVDEGFLYSKERSGYFVSDDFRPAATGGKTRQSGETRLSSDWTRRLRLQPSRQTRVAERDNWQDYNYPFVYDKLDKTQFPFSEWRECARDANSSRAIQSWGADSMDSDSARLLEQLHIRTLPERGVWVNLDEILVTLSPQHSLYLLSRLLVGQGTSVGIEDPGSAEARRIFKSAGARIVPIPLDAEGMIVDQRLAACDMVYVTPRHQCPTTITMSKPRRDQLMAAADQHDFIVIEDDTEGETDFHEPRLPALKTNDANERIIYVGGLTRTLAPGLQLGYLVASASLIGEARALRRLMVCHPPSNNQHAAALFLARGYHETLLHRLTLAYAQRWQTMHEALRTYLPGVALLQAAGGTSCWLQAPTQVDSRELAAKAAERGVLIEPAHMHFAATHPPRNYVRLGFAAIANERIEPGIASLAQLIQASGRTKQAL